MPTIYMAFWSIVMVLVAGLWRFRSLAQVMVATLTTAVTLFLSYALFSQLSLAVGLTPDPATFDPAAYLGRGIFGWMALLVMPCGWLAPVLGLRLAQKLEPGATWSRADE
jgi:hypothetical protein